eukprot:GHVP01009153.1.p1 GENE.GHVP01009153.1~~GHVP01009153.1.p1  ORF type:complete len:101 (-),score=7.46 GHVP01009153.1:787-1089(-)
MTDSNEKLKNSEIKINKKYVKKGFQENFTNYGKPAYSSYSDIKLRLRYVVADNLRCRYGKEQIILGAHGDHVLKQSRRKLGGTKSGLSSGLVVSSGLFLL